MTDFRPSTGKHAEERHIKRDMMRAALEVVEESKHGERVFPNNLVENVLKIISKYEVVDREKLEEELRAYLTEDVNLHLDSLEAYELGAQIGARRAVAQVVENELNAFGETIISAITKPETIKDLK